ncbi:MAG: glycosyltransferase family 2 protein [Candidatus Paceibacterota bacterium]|jgi:glycosyltransferase involved in cell wall biosynthesis
MLSIIIPSYKDPLLQKTIDSLLANAEGEIEIIAILDGYWPEIPLKDDPRLRILYLGQNQGMRGAINAGVAVARGEYLMRTDEHCIFAKGYDVILTKDCEHDWIVTPRRYFLDAIKWEVMDLPYVDHEKLIVTRGERKKFSGHRWPERDEERKEIMIDEKMAMQGSCWVMKKSWWDRVIVELQSEGYGTHYQDSIEMIFKTWKAGGKLMLNKNTWYAHKHRSFPRTHNYGGELADASFKYGLDTWGEYYKKVIKPRWQTSQ